MPIHEFSCAKCGNEFEEIVFGDTEVKCPSCGSMETEKLISCCRWKNAGGVHGPRMNKVPPKVNSPYSKSKCGGCSGGNCSTC